MATASPDSVACLEQVEGSSLQQWQEQGEHNRRSTPAGATFASSAKSEEEHEHRQQQHKSETSGEDPRLQGVNGWSTRTKHQLQRGAEAGGSDAVTPDRADDTVPPKLALARLSDGLPSLAAFLAEEANLGAAESLESPSTSSNARQGKAREALEAAVALSSAAAAAATVSATAAEGAAATDTASALAVGAGSESSAAAVSAEQEGEEAAIATAAAADDAGGEVGAAVTPRRRQRVVGPELYLRWQMLAKRVERVKGVCYSSTRHEWIAVGPVQHGSSGRKKNVYFSVPRYGFSEARQLAVECRRRQEEILAGGGDKAVDAAAIAAELTEKYRQRAGAAAAAAAAAGQPLRDGDDSDELERLGLTLMDETDEGSKTDADETAAAADTDSSRGAAAAGASGEAQQAGTTSGGRPYELRKRRPPTTHLTDDEATDGAFRKTQARTQQHPQQQNNPRKRGRPPRSRTGAPLGELPVFGSSFAHDSQQKLVQQQPRGGVELPRRVAAAGSNTGSTSQNFGTASSGSSSSSSSNSINMRLLSEALGMVLQDLLRLCSSPSALIAAGVPRDAVDLCALSCRCIEVSLI